MLIAPTGVLDGALFALGLARVAGGQDGKFDAELAGTLGEAITERIAYFCIPRPEIFIACLGQHCMKASTACPYLQL